MRSSTLLLALVACVLGASLVAAQSTDPCYNACNAAASTCMNACMTTCPHADLGCIQTCDASCFTAAGVCIKACPNSHAVAPKKVAAPVAAVAAPKKDVPALCLGECAVKTIECEKSCKQHHKHFGCKAKCVLKAAECAAECEVSEKAPVAPAAATMTEAQYQAEFTGFVRKYGKKYTHDEFFARYTIFKANLNKIRAHAMTKSSYTMAVNEFADMTFTEFHSKMTGYKRRDNAIQRSKNGPHTSVKHVADSIDWRQKGAVTPVKNQQQCGSCWAFSTTGSTEGAHAIKTGRLVSLSEQQLVDCSAAQGNNGCNGGMMDQGFQYIITNGGITTEAAYPYTAADGTCNTAVTSAATLSSFVDVTAGSEAALLQAVNVGPVSIAIEADQQCFQFYSGGVLSDPSCGTQLDHGVLVVGYGTDAATNTPYWIVKNSWGASWGEAGYIRLIRGQNECGVAAEASYPVV